MDRHKKFYKARMDPSDARTSRNNTTIELRQNRRDNIIEAKRMMCSLGNSSESNQNKISSDINFSPLNEELVQKLLKDAQTTSDPELRLKTTEMIRQYLSVRDKSQPFEIFIKYGLIPVMVENLKQNDPKLKFESLWVLTNVASGPSEYTKLMADMGCIPILISCLSNSDYRIIDQAIWTLGNIIGDGPFLRNVCMKSGLVTALTQLLEANQTHRNILKTISWVTINICRGKDNPIDDSFIVPVVQLIAAIIRHDDDDSIRDCMWALNYLVDSSPRIATIIIKTGFIEFIVNLVDRSNDLVTETVIRCLGNIAAGPDALTQYVISLNIIPMLIKVLSSDSTSLVHETLWLISNIAAGTKEQLQFIFQDQILNYVIYFAINGHIKDQREALWVISNIVNNGTLENVKTLLSLDVIDAISSILKNTENQIIAHSLETLQNIFKICNDQCAYISKQLEESGGLEAINNLQFSSTKEISNISKYIFDKFVIVDDGDKLVIPDDFDMSRSEFNF